MFKAHVTLGVFFISDMRIVLFDNYMYTIRFVLAILCEKIAFFVTTLVTFTIFFSNNEAYQIITNEHTRKVCWVFSLYYCFFAPWLGSFFTSCCTTLSLNSWNECTVYHMP